MVIQAIISEYNPFHNGHLYQLNKACALTHADYTISLMGGNFLQRGDTAMWNKYLRAAMSIKSGIDLTLELPFPYATGSAGDFAMGAVCILNRLCCVNYLVFGAECEDLNILKKAAHILCNEPAEYSNFFKKCISEGMSYPAARAKSISYAADDSVFETILSAPNNTLAIEYLIALERTGSDIQPVLIKRTNNYNDKSLSENISSATAIRHAIRSDEFVSEQIKKAVPAETFNLILQAHGTQSPVTTDMLTPFIQSALLNKAYRTNICDINDALINKLEKTPLNANFKEMIASLKTKNITESRIKRCLLHTLLHYTQSDRTDFANDGCAYYANILGLKKSSGALVRYINKHTSIPLITKKADAKKIIGSFPSINKEHALIMWEMDMKATELFNCLIKNSFDTDMPNDYRTILPTI